MLKIKGMGYWILSLLGAAVLLAVVAEANKNINVDNLKEQDEPVTRRYMDFPNNLVRFLFFNSRQNPGYKRSSSALDALTGVTLGKRSGPVDYLNLDPIYGRQFGMRSTPRMYDLRWAPLDAYESGDN